MSDQLDRYITPRIPREWGDTVAALPPARLVRRNLQQRLVQWVMVPASIVLILWTPVLTSDSRTLAGVIAFAVLTLVVAWRFVVVLRAQPMKAPPLLIARAGYFTAEGAHPGWALALDNVGGQTAYYDLDEITWRITRAGETWTATGISGLRMDLRTRHWPCVGDRTGSQWSISAAGTDKLLYVPARDAQRISRLVVTVEFEDDRGDRYAQDFLLSPAEAVAAQAVAP